MAVTAGLVGSWEWLICCAGQSDWMGTLTAPASRAESGGSTVLSLTLHSDSQLGRRAVMAAPSWLSRLLPGTS